MKRIESIPPLKRFRALIAVSGLKGLLGGCSSFLAGPLPHPTAKRAYLRKRRKLLKGRGTYRIPKKRRTLKLETQDWPENG